MIRGIQNPSLEHHYVPQFYMRRFACADDGKKVMVLERHGPRLVADRKSIERIGYEERLHDFEEDGRAGSIESDINTLIETPFSEGRTWSKIVARDYGALDFADGLSIYSFARHLQRRNLATLRFIDAEHGRYLAGDRAGFDPDDLAMHQRLAQAPGSAHRLFREGIMDPTLPDDAGSINVMICRAPIPFRTSTNPTMIVSQPGVPSVFGEMFSYLRTWWLPLDPNCGAFIIAGGPHNFTNESVPSEIAQVLNRRYIVQMLHGAARYVLGDDVHLEPDLEWAGFAHEQNTTRGFRYRATTWRDPNIEAGN